MQAHEIRAALRSDPNAEFAVKVSKHHRDPTFVRVRGLIPAGIGKWRYAEATDPMRPDQWREVGEIILSSLLEPIEDAIAKADNRREKKVSNHAKYALACRAVDRLVELGVGARCHGKCVLVRDTKALLDLLERVAGNMEAG